MKQKLTLATLALATLSILTLPACKKTNSDDLKETVPFYQVYTVTYDKNTNGETKTKAAAFFRVRDQSGSKVELNNGASVTANGGEPNSFQIVATDYDWDFDGAKDVQFVLTKNSGEKITNTVATSDIGQIAFPSNLPISISKGTGLTFNWAGDALNNETLTVKVTGSPLSSNVTASIDKEITGGQVVLTSSDFANFSPGTIFITLERDKILALDAKDGTAGGDITVVSKTKIDMALQN
jgi:hypothetical protein